MSEQNEFGRVSVEELEKAFEAESVEELPAGEGRILSVFLSTTGQTARTQHRNTIKTTCRERTWRMDLRIIMFAVMEFCKQRMIQTVLGIAEIRMEILISWE